MYGNSYGRRSSGGSYGRSRRSYGSSYGRSRRSYGSSRYAGGGFGGYQRPPAKRTGAKFISKAANGNPCIHAWRVTRDGIMSLVASPTKKGMVSEQSEQWVCKVSVPNRKPETVTGFFNVNTKKLVIPDLSLVANPGVSGGGYFGSFIKRRR